MELSSFVAAGDLLIVHLNSSFSTVCPGDTRTSTTSSNVLVEEPEQVESETQLFRKRKLNNLIWNPRFRNFRIWRMNFRSEVSSCASRPIEAMVWINEVDSAKSSAETKTSFTITGAKLQTDFEVLDILDLRVVLRRSSTETSKEEPSFKQKPHKKKNDFSREGKSHGWCTSIQRSATEKNPSWTSMRFWKVDLKNDNVQSVNTRWDGTIIAMKKQPDKDIL